MWLLQAWQCLFLVVLVFAVLGFMRGWRRELVSVAFTLGAAFLIAMGGGTAIAQTIFERIPLALQDPSHPQPVTAPNPTATAVVTALTLVGLILLGYFVGNKVFPRPATPADRFLGAVIGIGAGIVIYYIVSLMAPYLTKGPGFSFFISAPSQAAVGSSFLIIFIIVAVLLIVGLITSRAKKPGGAGGKK